MLGDVLDDSPGNTVQGIAAKISKLHPQTKALFKEVENLIKLSHVSLPQLHHRREHRQLFAA